MADEIAGGGAGGNGGPQPPTFTLLPPQPGALAVSDTAFEEFYKALDDFAPTIPDGLTEHYLLRCGFAAPDERLVRLISLAAQQFISDIAAQARDVAEQRAAAGAKEKRERGLDVGTAAAAAPGGAKGKDSGARRLVLTPEDLAEALSGKGVRIAKPPYWVGAAPASGRGGGAGGAGGGVGARPAQ